MPERAKITLSALYTYKKFLTHLLTGFVWKHQLHDLEECQAPYTLECCLFSLQGCSEQVQEHLLHTGGTLKPSSAISIENLKPKGMGKVQEKLSKY